MPIPPLNFIEPREAIRLVRDAFGCSGEEAAQFLCDRWIGGEIIPRFIAGEPPGGADPTIADWLAGAIILPDKWLPRRAVSEPGDDPEWQRIPGRSFPFKIAPRQLEAILAGAGRTVTRRDPPVVDRSQREPHPPEDGWPLVTAIGHWVPVLADLICDPSGKTLWHNRVSCDVERALRDLIDCRDDLSARGRSYALHDIALDAPSDMRRDLRNLIDRWYELDQSERSCALNDLALRLRCGLRSDLHDLINRWHELEEFERSYAANDLAFRLIDDMTGPGAPYVLRWLPADIGEDWRPIADAHRVRLEHRHLHIRQSVLEMGGTRAPVHVFRSPDPWSAARSPELVPLVIEEPSAPPPEPSTGSPDAELPADRDAPTRVPHAAQSEKAKLRHRVKEFLEQDSNRLNRTGIPRGKVL